jgi:hypothetical protein
VGSGRAGPPYPGRGVARASAPPGHLAGRAGRALSGRVRPGHGA